MVLRINGRGDVGPAVAGPAPDAGVHAAAGEPHGRRGRPVPRARPKSGQSRRSPLIRLSERFPAYRITYDPARQHPGDPWIEQIPCRFGTIYPHGHATLAVEVDYHPGIARRLQLAGFPLAQDGDHEKTFVFPPEAFAAVAGLVRPYRKPGARPRRRGTRKPRISRA